MQRNLATYEAPGGGLAFVLVSVRMLVQALRLVIAEDAFDAAAFGGDLCKSACGRCALDASVGGHGRLTQRLRIVPIRWARHESNRGVHGLRAIGSELRESDWAASGVRRARRTPGRSNSGSDRVGRFDQGKAAKTARQEVVMNRATGDH